MEVLGTLLRASPDHRHPPESKIHPKMYLVGNKAQEEGWQDDRKYTMQVQGTGQTSSIALLSLSFLVQRHPLY